MSDKVQPVWTWDEEIQAGYIDFDPEYEGVRRAKVFKATGSVSILADFNQDGEIVGIEVLV